MPIKWKSKVILAKLESSYGVDPTPTGAADAMLMTNVTLTPMDGEDVSRDLEFPYLAAQGMIPTGLRVRLQGRVELSPSGTAGTAPAWGPLLRSCGIAETISAGVSVTYDPISNGMESAHIYFWIGDTRQIIAGVRGTAAFKLTAQQVPYIEFDLMGLYADPTELAPATPTLTAFQKPQIVTDANTPTFSINAVDMVLREFTLGLNNQVEARLLVGSDSIIIPDRAESISARVEAVPVTTLNPFTLAKAQTLVPVALAHGIGAGRIATFDFPTCQLKRLSGFENAQNTLEWPLELVPLPASGNDQWSLALT